MDYYGVMYTLKRWKIKPILFAVIFLCASVSTSFLAAPQANANAEDVPSLLINNDLYKDVSAHQHYWWLRACFRNIDVDEISTDEMAKWDIFEGTGNSQILGAMYGSDNGMHDCQDEDIVK